MSLVLLKMAAFLLSFLFFVFFRSFVQWRLKQNLLTFDIVLFVFLSKSINIFRGLVFCKFDIVCSYI